MRRHPLPLPVRMPLGVDLHTEEIKGPLAPGNQPLQSCLHVPRINVTGLADAQGIRRKITARRPLRQRVQRRQPTGQITMGFVQQALPTQAHQRVPLGLGIEFPKRGVALLQIIFQHQRTASREIKLKQRNHTWISR